MFSFLSIAVCDSLLKARGSKMLDRPLLGKPLPSLGPRLGRWAGDFPAWYSPWTVTRYCSSMLGVMKSQCALQGWSKETSAPWNGWAGNVEHTQKMTKVIFSLILAGTDPVYQWLAPCLGSQPEFGVFWQWDDQHNTRPVLSGGIQISYVGKRVFAHELSGLTDRL